MRKIHIILLSVFTAGVLLGGIGTGIAFREYSTMEYGETVLLGEDDLVTGQLIYEFEPVPGEKIGLHPYYGINRGKSILEEDEALPMGTICYDFTYNERLTAPHLSYWENDDVTETCEEPVENDPAVDAGEDEESREQTEARIIGFLELRTNYIGSEFELFMKNKNRILSDLKQKKINSYETAYITDVKIRVNPGMMEYIEDYTSR